MQWNTKCYDEDHGQLRNPYVDQWKSKFSFIHLLYFILQCWWQLNPLLLIQLQYTKLPKPNSHFLTPQLQLKCNQPLVRSQWYPQVAKHQVQTQSLTQSSQMTPTRLYLVSKKSINPFMVLVAEGKFSGVVYTRLIYCLPKFCHPYFHCLF